MKVMRRKNAQHPFRYPTCLRKGLALGAVAIAARVVRRTLSAAIKTNVEMTTELCGAAALDGAEHRKLLAAQAVALPKRLARLADDVRQF
jgi:hypothetical protein